MSTKYIWVKNQRYYLFDTYNNKKTAREVAQKYCKTRKRNGKTCKYFIIATESFITGNIVYAVYFNRVLSLQSF